MTIALVTGGAGFIGSNLVSLLVKNKIEVRVIDDLSTGYRKNLSGLNVQFIEGDVRNFPLVEQAANGTDMIFHLAASVGRQKSLIRPQADAEVNVVGTVNVLEAARINKVKRIVYSSSAAIFGELLTMPIAEDHPQNPDSPYGVSKLGGEKQTLCFAGLYDMTAVCLRYFNVYGINQRYDAYGNVIPIFANRIYRDEPLTIYGDGEQTRDFVNVKDVAMANFLAGTVASKTAVYNIGSGINITINSLASMMKMVSNSKVGVVYEPVRPADVRHCRADISKASQELGFSPNPDIETGLKEYMFWFTNDMKM
jgi:nucleoside-diphosphate-sugar epimerase